MLLQFSVLCTRDMENTPSVKNTRNTNTKYIRQKDTKMFLIKNTKMFLDGADS